MYRSMMKTLVNAVMIAANATAFVPLPIAIAAIGVAGISMYGGNGYGSSGETSGREYLTSAVIWWSR